MSTAPRSRNLLLLTARGLWVLIVGLHLWFLIGGLAPLYAELSSVCPVEPCRFLNLTAEGVRELENLGVSHATYAGITVGLEALAVIAILLPAGLIFWRMGDEWLGLLVSIALVLFGLNFMAEADNAFFRAYPAYVKAYDLFAAAVGVPFVSLFFLFPNGRFVPRWTAWLLAGMAVVAVIDPFLVAAGYGTPNDPVSPLFTAALSLCMLIGIGAQVHRYRFVSNPSERQQTKWVVFGLSGLLIVVFTYILFFSLPPSALGLPQTFFNLYIYPLDISLYLLFPVTVTLSILRYRLWDIDLIVRRTLSYALLSGALALVFFGGVVLMQFLLRAVTGEASSPLATVLSTLGIAALFNPLRLRTQAFIDRRFYRAKYDAEQTLQRFADTARDEVDLARLAGSLVGVVEETVRPEKVSLWVLRE